MDGKIILNLAVSLDGYIADENGGFDWIKGQDDRSCDTSELHDFSKFLDSVDIVVMGKKCYDQGMANDYKQKKVYIATSQKAENSDNINFIGGDIVKTITKEKNEGKNIFLFGGGVMIDSFIKANVIDEYIVGIVPTLLGKGRKLFLENNPTVLLKLQKYIIDDGIVLLHYALR